MDNQKQKQRLDTFLVTTIFLLVAISIYTLYTLDQHYEKVYDGYYLDQIKWFVVSSIGVATIMFIDFDRYRKFAWPLYILGIFMLAGLHFLPWGYENNGALRWYQFGSTTLQPSEFVKVFLVVALAHVITSHNEKWQSKDLNYDLVLLGKILGLSLPVFVLIAIQPDIGSSLVIASIAAFLIIISGIRWRTVITLFGSVFVIIATLVIIYFANPDGVIEFIEDTPFDHVADRIQAWDNPHLYQDSSAMQAIKSMMAIGSGQLSGKGSMQYQVWIPERHTDMIFTAIAEQFGFVGSSVIIVLFFLMIYRIIQIALECKEPFGTYLCVGIVGMFTYQIFQNIGMSIQLLPLTGLPLPFLSYGGTSLLVYMAAIGLVLNVRSRQKTFMFESNDD
ncbi:FtsW/RodA/SpoVE family cell cycle protein [Tenuibacillus multivorans]|uniref:Cell division protein FtsW, lipid II flippase n=1 Tax=Tenuibacillus multivorans TaxID=237069 RepID=A0A1H0EIM1_9BACI|nr:FtsW/RodA/SpoVE family cell cycle protein [Tenuibacillus multivorans]GEL77142.1 cell division protein FtsW [Tenuibacillus multivorans]SDN82205.1 cell division protein FtsW, lipid II flippase [Tenuibacillus multivorans]